VDREELGAPEVYGKDRVFAYIRLESAPRAEQDDKIGALEKAGEPTVRITVTDTYNLGQEFFRWEIATAVAGSLLGINPFNQPDVEASKVATRALTSEFEKSGSLPPEKPVLEEDGIRLFTDSKNAEALAKAAGSDKSLAGYIQAHLGRIAAGDYLALLAYIEMSPEHEGHLQEIRQLVRDKKHAATCVGFGPRFLHSTGQAYKGGPNSGVFLQITCDDAVNLPVPGHKFSFGVVKAAQARGDFQVLAERGRRALRVHLSKEVEGGLAKLALAIRKALAA
jgi:transaldolase/glucose-6-phosphate isomerase